MCKLISVSAVGLALSLAAASSPAAARGGGSDWRECNGRDLDARIAACTRILDRGRDSANNRASAYNNRGIAYFSKGEIDRAIKDFDEAIQIKPNNAVLYHNRGLAWYGKGDNEQAIRSYDEAIAINPKYPMVRNDRANVFFRMKEYDKAISGYDDAIRLQPKDPILYANRGNTYRFKKDYDRALRDFDDAIRLGPREPSSVYGRSLVYSDKGDYGRALADLDEAIRFKQDNADYWNARGFIYKQQGDHDRAIRDLDEAIKLKPKFATAFSNRGDAWRQRGDLERAIMDLSEAIRLDPSVTPAYVNRGLAFEAKGDIEQAKFDFSTALTRTPGDFTTTKDAVAKARERLAALGQPSTAPPPATSRAPQGEAQIAGQGVSQAALPVVPSRPPEARIVEPRPSDVVERGPRVALVIGNAAYTSATSLANPVNDAREMSGALRDLGFRVIEGYNLTSATMRGKIAEFGAALPGAGVALFYYAGHGMQVAGKNYLVPVDAKLERPSSLGVEAIEVSTVISDMEAEKRVNLVFLDACRDNPLSKNLARSMGGSRSAAVGQGLAQLNAGIGTLITFATSPDTIALDGSGRNSPFTQAMLKYIRTPGLEVRSMLTRVRADVIKATNEQQVPWDHSSLTGDFYFKPGS